MQTMTRTRYPTPPTPQVPVGAPVPPSAVAGRIATHMIQSAGTYGRRASATMFLWLLATRDTPPESDF